MSKEELINRLNQMPKKQKKYFKCEIKELFKRKKVYGLSKDETRAFPPETIMETISEALEILKTYEEEE